MPGVSSASHVHTCSGCQCWSDVVIPHLQVDLSLSLPQPGNEHEPEKTLAVATGIFTKIGALRAM